MLNDKNPLVSPNNNRQFQFPRSSGVLGPRAKDQLPFLQQRHISRDAYHNTRDSSFPSLTGQKLKQNTQSVLSPASQNPRVRKRSYTDPVFQLQRDPIRKGKLRTATVSVKAMEAPPVNFGRSAPLFLYNSV